MDIGVFDHLDRGGPAITPDYYESRLQLLERYDAIGIRSYHLAEHHGTPLGMAPSPNLFLAAAAQRTKRLRFGPLVYCLPLYHPLRLLEEICMLDQMSGGRLEMGIGRGISPYEVGYYGVDYQQAPAMYREAFELIIQGLAADELHYAGEYYSVDGMTMELKPVQTPHPPLWYGLNTPDGAVWPAENGVNIVSSEPAQQLRAVTDRYRETWDAAGKAQSEIPRMGMNRFVYVGETETEARTVIERAYPVWRQSIMALWNRYNSAPRSVRYVETFAELEALGQGIAGTPEQVAEKMAAQYDAAGINYFLCRFAFGDLTLEESMRSVDLFAERVTPALDGIT